MDVLYEGARRLRIMDGAAGHYAKNRNEWRTVVNMLILNFDAVMLSVLAFFLDRPLAFDSWSLSPVGRCWGAISLRCWGKLYKEPNICTQGKGALTTG